MNAEPTIPADVVGLVDVTDDVDAIILVVVRDLPDELVFIHARVRCNIVGQWNVAGPVWRCPRFVTIVNAARAWYRSILCAAFPTADFLAGSVVPLRAQLVASSNSTDIHPS